MELVLVAVPWVAYQGAEMVVVHQVCALLEKLLLATAVLLMAVLTSAQLGVLLGELDQVEQDADPQEPLPDSMRFLDCFLVLLQPNHLEQPRKTRL